MAVRALNQLIGRVGLFIIDCALQPQRAGAAGGGVPGVSAAGSLGNWPWTFCRRRGLPQGRRGLVMQPVSQSRMQSSQLWKPQPDSGGRSPPLDAWNSVRPLMAILVQPAPARNFGA